VWVLVLLDGEPSEACCLDMLVERDAASAASVNDSDGSFTPRQA
jgi:hypothetical protein